MIGGQPQMINMNQQNQMSRGGPHVMQQQYDINGRPLQLPSLSNLGQAYHHQPVQQHNFMGGLQGNIGQIQFHPLTGQPM